MEVGSKAEFGFATTTTTTTIIMPKGAAKPLNAGTIALVQCDFGFDLFVEIFLLTLRHNLKCGSYVFRVGISDFCFDLFVEIILLTLRHNLKCGNYAFRVGM